MIYSYNDLFILNGPNETILQDNLSGTSNSLKKCQKRLAVPENLICFTLCIHTRYAR